MEKEEKSQISRWQHCTGCCHFFLGAGESSTLSLFSTMHLILFILLGMLPPSIEFGLEVLFMQVRRRRRASEIWRGRYWVHPLTAVLLTCGSFVSLYHDLRAHPEKFCSYFRMTVQSFDYLLQHVSHRIQRQVTHLRKSVLPVECLMVTLR